MQYRKRERFMINRLAGNLVIITPTGLPLALKRGDVTRFDTDGDLVDVLSGEDFAREYEPAVETGCVCWSQLESDDEDEIDRINLGLDDDEDEGQADDVPDNVIPFPVPEPSLAEIVAAAILARRRLAVV